LLNRNIFRELPDLVRADLRRRGQEDRLPDVDRMVDLDARARRAGARADELRRQVKESSAAIGKTLKAGGDAEAAREAVRRLGDELDAVAQEQVAVEAERDALELTFPNLLHEAVPSGAGSEDNHVVRTWGQPPEQAFDPVPHDELGTRLGILDFERATKVAGARFTFLVGAGARLEHALVQLMRDVHREAGDVELIPPYLVNAATLQGTGQLPKFAADLFQVGGPGGYYLIPTAEVPVTNYHAGEILEAADLPRRYFAYSPCFRSEAGSYGKDVRGYIRQHHFHKVEMVRITTPEQAIPELEAMTLRAEGVLQRLGLAHRVVKLCSADTGFGSAMTYDVEVWLPSQRAYREISSCSTCSDFQARRARIRYRPAPGARAELCHTLNGSGLAVGRTLVAILEQCQRSDGSVEIPPALRPYFGAPEIRGA
jgi:seryl-tRNA synthetase